jgi:hypothetical protein
MPINVNEINWTRIAGGRWNFMGSGPSWHFVFLHLLWLRSFNDVPHDVNLSWRRYSAVPPFFIEQTVLGASARSVDDVNPSVLIPAGTSSPWTEIWVHPDVGCFARLFP